MPTALSTAAIAAALLALILAGWLARRVARLSAQLRDVERQRPVGDGDLAALRFDLAQALRHVAVVRDDAFGDRGGHSDAPLTPEEQQALAAARTGKEKP